MEAIFIGIKIVNDQETELKQCNYAKYPHTKTKLYRRGLRALSLCAHSHGNDVGLACNPIANVHHQSHTVMVP